MASLYDNIQAVQIKLPLREIQKKNENVYSTFRNMQII